ncbi:MAG: NAD-dependent epimerase/dehydratase family protein [Nitrospirales bacterium]
MKILVTGGAGYIGSILVPALLDEGYQVTVLDNFLYRQSSLMDCCANSNFEMIRGDCRDEKVLHRLVTRHDCLIPLAALVGAPACEQDRVCARSVNFDAVQLLCKLASPSQMILFPVTNSGYGIGEPGQYCTEDTPLRPISLYGESKVRAEKVVLDRESSVTFRLATVFGASPRMRIDLLVNDFVYRAMHDRAVTIFEGHLKRNYVHIRDVARAFIYAIEHFETMKGKPYNLGLEDANLSKIELSQVIQKFFPNFVYLEASVGEDPDKRDYIVSNARILGTGYNTQWSLEDGIRELTKCFTVLRNNSYANV